MGFAPGTGYAASRRETSFAVGLKGVADADLPEVERRIQATFEQVGKDGFPRERVQAGWVLRTNTRPTLNLLLLLSVLRAYV